MLGYLKHLYAEISEAILSKSVAAYPLLAKSALVLLGAIAVWAFFRRSLKAARKRMQKYEFVRIHNEIFGLIQRAVWYALIFVCGIYLVKLFRIPILEKVFYAGLIILLAVPVKDFTLLALRYLEANFIRKTESKIDDIVFDLLNKFSGVIIFAVAVLLALDVLGINVVPLVAGAGVAGIAIGFAAKDTLSNLIAGILLIVDRPFEIGDRIEVWSAPQGSSTWGDVIDIGIRGTKIRTTDNIVIIIPNNEIMKRDIVNYTTISTDIRVRIPIGVSYDTNIKKAKSAILGVAKTAEWVLKDRPPVVVVRQFGESSVDLELRVWIKDARRRMDTVSYMTDEIKEAFDREGIEIPYPKRDITITKASGGNGEKIYG
ncbi:MAG: mechanosensitive ion channel family protein [Desulfobacterales bacterium]|nr:mechanosensitive ion channel family protein [Desulfobacterales bacterium]